MNIGIADMLKKVTGAYEREEDYEQESASQNGLFEDGYPVASRNSGKILSIPATTHLQVIVIKPEKYSDAAEIADHFKNKKTVLLNLDNTNKDVANRLLDFLGGVAYATDGDLKRIANTTYIIVPFNVEISGDMIDELENSSDLF
jgi:cell division inhibitor SepF